MGTRRGFVIFGTVTAILFAVSAHPSSAQSMRDLKACIDPNTHLDEKIRTCSIFIQTRRKADGTPAPASALAGIHEIRAFAYMYRREFKRAIADLEQAIELTPSNQVKAESYSGLAGIYMGERDFDRAFSAADQATRLNPKLGWGYFTRGLVYNERGELDRGRADIETAARLDPKHKEYIEDYAELTLDWKNYLKEIQDERDYPNWSAPPLDAFLGSRLPDR